MSLTRPSTLWRYTARTLRRRPGRTVLTLLGIAIGVATAVAVSLTVEAARQAHREMFSAVAGDAALEVVAEGLGGFDERLAERVEGVAGVRTVVPAIQSPAAFIGPAGVVPVMVVGSDPQRDGAARALTVRAGHLPGTKGARGTALEAGFAAANRLDLGQKARLFSAGGQVELPVVALLEPRGPAAFNGGAVAFLPLASAQELFGLTGKVNTLRLVLADGAEPSAVEAEVTARLPPGMRVQVPAARGALGRDGMFTIEQSLASLSASAAVAGAFVILNAFLMSLGERRRQLAVLRALGATRRQVTFLLLREAFLLGCAGTLLGVALGLGLSVVFRQVIGFLNAITLPDPGWPPGPFLLALGLGPGMALAAALVPARRAARRAPLEDLLQKGEAPGARARLWPGYIGLGLIAGLGVFVFGITRDWFDHAVATALLAPTLAGYLAGWVLIVPLILGPLHRLTAAALRPLLGREGDLAFRQLARRPGRTSLTAGVLLAALVLSVGSGQQLLNNLRHIDGWIDRVVSADFFIRGTWPDITVAVTTAALPDGLAAEVEQLGPAVARVDRFGYVLGQAAPRDSQPASLPCRRLAGERRP
jgi:putative ABC transport system permease protein